MVYITIYTYLQPSLTPPPSPAFSPCPPPVLSCTSLPTYPCDRRRLSPQGGEKSAWARTSSNSSSTQKNGGGPRTNSNNDSRNNSANVARRFDIDQEEAADGEELARVRGGRHSHYSFDTRAGGERAERAAGGGGGARKGRGGGDGGGATRS